MNTLVDKCMNCGNYSSGQMKETFERKVTRKAVKKSFSYIFPVLGGLIGLPIPGVGSITLGIIGLYIGALLDEKIAKLADDSIKILHPTGTCNYTCPKCGNSWSKEVNLKNDYVTDQALEKQKLEVTAQLSASETPNKLKVITSIAITIYCGWYCYDNPATYTNKNSIFGFEYDSTLPYWTWFICIIFCFICGSYSFFKIQSIIVNQTIKKEISAMTVAEYRNSKYRKW